ncbi:MAG TPA: sigma-70 family RNA polymerase sigma factor [Methylophilus sp.]|nr:sigma-70 family RNA polymerase sigma factor [Methylophilus sp.]
MQWAYKHLIPGIVRHTECNQYAYDVLHDAILRFALSANPDKHQRPHAYLRVIVNNLLLDSYHRDARQAAINLHAATANTHYEPSAECLADMQQRLMLLQQIIEKLPRRCREVFWLFKIEGLTQQQIAAQLGISVNMVERHMIRALMDLRAAKQYLL